MLYKNEIFIASTHITRSMNGQGEYLTIEHIIRPTFLAVSKYSVKGYDRVPSGGTLKKNRKIWSVVDLSINEPVSVNLTYKDAYEQATVLLMDWYNKQGNP